MKATIHIFGYGETQIISNEVNFKAKTSTLKKVQAVIDDIKSKNPSGKKAAQFHVINIFQGKKVDYLSGNEKGSFSVKGSGISAAKLNALIAELSALSAKK